MSRGQQQSEGSQWPRAVSLPFFFVWPTKCRALPCCFADRLEPPSLSTPPSRIETVCSHPLRPRAPARWAKGRPRQCSKLPDPQELRQVPAESTFSPHSQLPISWEDVSFLPLGRHNSLSTSAARLTDTNQGCRGAGASTLLTVGATHRCVQIGVLSALHSQVTAARAGKTHAGPWQVLSQQPFSKCRHFSAPQWSGLRCSQHRKLVDAGPACPPTALQGDPAGWFFGGAAE